MDTIVYSDPKGTICDRCNYLVDEYTTVPWEFDTAKVCLECNEELGGNN